MARTKREETPSNDAAPDEGLIPMSKDGDIIDVHPNCVEAHEKAGWKVVE